MERNKILDDFFLIQELEVGPLVWNHIPRRKGPYVSSCCKNSVSHKHASPTVANDNATAANQTEQEKIFRYSAILVSENLFPYVLKWYNLKESSTKFMLKSMAFTLSSVKGSSLSQVMTSPAVDMCPLPSTSSPTMPVQLPSPPLDPKVPSSGYFHSTVKFSAVPKVLRISGIIPSNGADSEVTMFHVVHGSMTFVIIVPWRSSRLSHISVLFPETSLPGDHSKNTFFCKLPPFIL